MTTTHKRTRTGFWLAWSASLFQNCLIIRTERLAIRSDRGLLSYDKSRSHSSPL
jgi:hypothetical protein